MDVASVRFFLRDEYKEKRVAALAEKKMQVARALLVEFKGKKNSVGYVSSVYSDLA